jgi:hypothetical protein
MLGLFNKSIPQEKIVHGYKIEKYPNGRYIKALSIISTLPQTLSKDLFPNLSMEEVLSKFTTIDEDMLVELFSKALTIIPEKAFEFVSLLTEIPYEDFMEKLTPVQTIDILRAVWEVNDFENFFGEIKKIIKGWLKKK